TESIASSRRDRVGRFTRRAPWLCNLEALSSFLAAQENGFYTTIGTRPGAADGALPADAAIDAQVETAEVGEFAFIESSMGGSNSTITSAAFATFTYSGSTRDDGPCHITLRTSGTVSRVSAGAITISYGTSGTYTLNPSSQDLYADQFPGFRFAANDTISISAAGATVPAFSKSIVFPAAVSVTSPTSLATLSKSGFSATWTNTSSMVHIVINQYPDSIHSTSIDCTFAGDSGGGAVPATALSDLLVASSGSTSVLIASSTTATGTAGTYPLTLQATDFGFSAYVIVQQ
ncbi:MAG TPA: hypothetical protein VMJ10_27300, partial [Kofleriaceae bacterium]|nr:hypothetical protein [Kofleriaceae bacterium]